MTISTVFKFEIDNARIDDMVDSVVDVVGERVYHDLRSVDLKNTKLTATVTVTLEPASLH